MADQGALFETAAAAPKKTRGGSRKAPERTIDDVVTAVRQFIEMSGRAPSDMELWEQLRTSHERGFEAIRAAYDARTIQFVNRGAGTGYNVVPPLDTYDDVLADVNDQLDALKMPPTELRHHLMAFVALLAKETKQ